MKKNYILILAGIISFSSYSQSNVTDFEDLNLSADSYWNGSDQSGQFISNTVMFNNAYDTAWGGSWSGVSYSNMKDDTTAGYGNQFSCIAAIGYNSSATYSIFNPKSNILVTIPNYGALTGFWINNSTYAYLSMKNGDSFAKKFGDSTNAAGVDDGTNGNDWFKLTIHGENSDSVEFYLADFRGSASADYILKDWTYVDLSTLNPNSKNLTFSMSSSDVGRFGMNTPKYFCMDNLTYTTSLSVVENIENSISIYPNPTQNNINVKFEETINNASYRLIDVAGREVVTSTLNGVSSLNLDLSNQNNGVYFLMINIEGEVITKKIIKQ